MFKDEGAILLAAATLARLQREASTKKPERGVRGEVISRGGVTETPVQALVHVLRDMEAAGLIPNGLVPSG